MADELPSLQIDTDWKKQAQQEKKRLAEKAAEPVKAAETPAPATRSGAQASRGKESGSGRKRDLPPANIGTLAQSLMTQTLYYLGDIAYQGGDPVANLDMAKHNIDLLAVLEEKAGPQLTPDEQKSLDMALHETRSRFVSVASQFI